MIIQTESRKSSKESIIYRLIAFNPQFFHWLMIFFWRGRQRQM